MNQGKDVEAVGDDCDVVGEGVVNGVVVVGGDWEREVCDEDGDGGDGVDGGVGGGAAGEVHLIGPGFFNRCWAHVQAVLWAPVLEMRVK